MENEKHEELMDYCSKWTLIYNDLLSMNTFKEYHEFVEEEIKSVKVFDL